MNYAQAFMQYAAIAPVSNQLLFSEPSLKTSNYYSWRKLTTVDKGYQQALQPAIKRTIHNT